MLTAETLGPKPGTITLVSCNLDLMTDPTPLEEVQRWRSHADW